MLSHCMCWWVSGDDVCGWLQPALRTARGSRDTRIERGLVSFIAVSHWCCLETVFACPFTEMSSGGPGRQVFRGSGDINVNWYGLTALRGSFLYLLSPSAPNFWIGRLQPRKTVPSTVPA